MDFPERFSKLPEYAFPRLRALLDGHEPGQQPLALSIGEPRHPMPDFLAGVLAGAVGSFGQYPANDGTPDLLQAISDWIGRRYGVRVGTERIMALNGSREGLFNTVLALCPESRKGRRPVVLMPNPFYQVYAVAALAAGAEPVYVAADAASGHLPDYAALPSEVLERTALAFLCSPANPQGAVASHEYWNSLLALAEHHGFRIIADECYSEIWRNAPPTGILQAAAKAGTDPERVISINSLSKRSNLPGLRSGFVAAGPEAMRRIRQLRAYAGAPLPEPLQAVAAACWRDEQHVSASLALYQRKYALADRILGTVPGYAGPQAGFFLWLPVPDGEAAALALWKAEGIRVLPGAYLGRDTGAGNPGAGYVRIAMVAAEDELEDGLRRLRACLYD